MDRDHVGHLLIKMNLNDLIMILIMMNLFKMILFKILRDLVSYCGEAYLAWNSDNIYLIICFNLGFGQIITR